VKKTLLMAAGSALALVASSALAEETGNNGVDLFASFGILGLEAKEHVFDSAGSSDHLSLLIWQSAAPVFSTGFDAELEDGWVLSGRANIGMGGASHMEDYDWITPFATPGSGMDNWSHQSIHPNTSLDWYFDGSLALGKDVHNADGKTVNLNVGAKYIDVQWAASDGTYTYSSATLRDTTGTFSGPGITYRQQLPSLFAGIDTEMVSGDWVFDVGAQAGLTFGATATDWHWMRDLRFEEAVAPAPTVGITAKATYNMGENVDFFVEGEFQKVFMGRSDTTIYTDSTNAFGGTFPDASGAELMSASIKIGVRGELN